MSVVSCSLSLLLASAGIVEVEVVVDDTVDLIEINHVSESTDRPGFTQVIFYDWDAQEGRFQVRTWRMHKQIQQNPYRDWSNGRYTLRFYDKGVLRAVHSQAVRHTWTNYDPELAARQDLPVHQRRGLTSHPKR